MLTLLYQVHHLHILQSRLERIELFSQVLSTLDVNSPLRSAHLINVLVILKDGIGWAQQQTTCDVSIC